MTGEKSDSQATHSFQAALPAVQWLNTQIHHCNFSKQVPILCAFVPSSLSGYTTTDQEPNAVKGTARSQGSAEDQVFDTSPLRKVSTTTLPTDSRLISCQMESLWALSWQQPKEECREHRGAPASQKSSCSFLLLQWQRKKWNEWGYLEMFLILKERGNNQEPVAGECRVSWRGISTVLPSCTHFSNFYTSWKTNSEG